MHPDLLFVGAGAACLCFGAFTAYRCRTTTPRPRRWLLTGLLWALLGAGFLVQGFAPHLKVEKNAFVIPASAGAKAVHPAAIVARERTMQALSAVLTVIGAAGLALHYGRQTLRPASRPGSISPSASSGTPGLS